MPESSPVFGAVSRRVCLHVGCGPAGPGRMPERFLGPGWSEIRVDIDPAVAPDVVASITDLSVLGSATADAVWSSHTLEHLHGHEVPLALGEFQRVLKPGGILLLAVPDLEQIAELIAAGRLEQVAYVSAAGPVTALDMLYGFGPSVAAGNAHMAHRTGFTAQSLAAALRQAGFGDIQTRRGEFSVHAQAEKPADAATAG